MHFDSILLICFYNIVKQVSIVSVSVLVNQPIVCTHTTSANEFGHVVIIIEYVTSTTIQTMCTCRLHPVYMRLTSSVHAAYIRCTCGLHPVYMRLTSGVHVAYIRYTCGLHAYCGCLSAIKSMYVSKATIYIITIKLYKSPIPLILPFMIIS